MKHCTRLIISVSVQIGQNAIYMRDNSLLFVVVALLMISPEPAAVISLFVENKHKIKSLWKIIAIFFGAAYICCHRKQLGAFVAENVLLPQRKASGSVCISNVF